MSNEYGTFEQYMRRVDGILASVCGLSYMDLADQPWRYWYEDEIPPREAAEMCLEDNGFPMELF